MSSFRNIIARRRPSGAPMPLEDKAGQDIDQPGGSASMEDLLAEINPSGRSTLVDVPPAPPELPKWEVRPPQKTMGPDPLRPVEDEVENDEVAQTEAKDVAETSRKIWDLDAAMDVPHPPKLAEAPMPDPVPQPAPQVAKAPPLRLPVDAPEVPDAALLKAVQSAPEVPAPLPPSAPAPAASGGRVKTRLLGFHSDDAVADLFAAPKASGAASAITCPVGWVVVIDGPGRGAHFALAPGLSTLGRGSDQTIALDFGDEHISRDNHASIAYDEEENKVLIGHGGKSNLVRLNGKPLVQATELANGDTFRLGKTVLRFVALCGHEFSWAQDARGDD